MASLPAIPVSENGGNPQKELSRWPTLVSSGFGKETLPLWIRWKSDQGQPSTTTSGLQTHMYPHTELCAYAHASMHAPHTQSGKKIIITATTDPKIQDIFTKCVSRKVYDVLLVFPGTPSFFVIYIYGFPMPFYVLICIYIGPPSFFAFLSFQERFW